MDAPAPAAVDAPAEAEPVATDLVVSSTAVVAAAAVEDDDDASTWLPLPVAMAASARPNGCSCFLA